MKKIFTAITALAFSAAVNATPINLDFDSGIFTGSGTSLTSYTEDGFTLSANLAANHLDDNWNGSMGFHNGLDNTYSNNDLTLSYGGASFDLLDIDLSYFHEYGELELIASNGNRFVSSSLGMQSVNFSNITSVTFSVEDSSDIAFSGVSWNSITVDDGKKGNSIPEPTSIALFGLALAGIGISRKKKAN